MTTKEDKHVEKIQEAFWNAAQDMIWDMRDINMKRSEITKIMIRDLKTAIDVEYEAEPDE